MDLGACRGYLHLDYRSHSQCVRFRWKGSVCVEDNHIAVLQQIVQIRAEQLKGEGVGYLKAISQISKELYVQEKGKDTPLGDIQPGSASFAGNAGIAAGSGTIAGSIPWDKVPWKDLTKVFDKAVQSVLKRRTQNRARFEEIRQQVTPWVAKIYLNQHSGS